MGDRLDEGQLPDGTGGDIDWMQRWRAAEAHKPGPTAGVLGEYDAFGRKVPRRLGIADYLLTIARSQPGRVRRVPSQAIAEEGEDDDGPFAFVECPCGMRPVVRAELEKCSGCHRNYVRFEGSAVFVAYGDGELPPLPAAAAS